jgi:glycosyltransferase involved in cell wall biosynthesis
VTPGSGADFSGLRISVVGPVPPPAGGMANQTRQLVELLRAAGACVELVPTNAAYRPALVAGVPVLRAAFRLVPYLAALWRSAGRNDLLHLMANSGWSWHLFAAPAIWIARLRGTPVLVNYRGGGAAAFLARSHRSVRRSLNALGRGTMLAVPSGFLREVFAKHRLPAQILPNIIDLGRFHPSPPPGRPPGGHLVVSRNLELIYDNATAVRAFALVRQRVPEARLTLAGSGDQEAALRALTAELGVAAAVRFSGQLDRDAMADLYRQADVAINPSLVDNTPNSVLEALASAVPLVSTQVGGVPWIVQDGTTARLVPPADPQAMADAVIQLLENPQVASAMATAGLEEVQRYTWPQVSAVLLDAYRSLLTTARRRT